MKQALIVVGLLLAAFLLVDFAAGFSLAAVIGLSAMAVIALVNALTFLWLWHVRATPLALGMALSWAGQAGLSIWWGLGHAERLLALQEGGAALFFMVSLYVVGGALHILVVQRSMEFGRTTLFWPIATAVGIAIAVSVML